ncbi:MAG: helix-turn-helix transcriptional regulator [Alphaproteobacteria bacterium]|nr:helix-turn-helix transcriptional regulator [Alphaproteobacteria bacterium]
MMKLQEYLDNNKKTVADLARACEVKHTVALRWANGARIPSRENMQKIFAYTDGQVEPNDFYNINTEEEKELNSVN